MATSLSRVETVFVYGTLLADEVVQVLLDRVPPSSTATVLDYHRHSIKGRQYPGVVPAKGQRVQGKVMFGLTEEEQNMFDAFEDTEYIRTLISAILPEGQEGSLSSTASGDQLSDGKDEDNSQEQGKTKVVPAYIYVWANHNDPNLYGDWSYEEWRAKNLDSFLESCRKFISDYRQTHSSS
eukprot:TRINITY_DN2296_c0_g1_i1.p1 TRINITY_DN2296_c0_g1~~TRINITY_DN2296_c0_g1_i1.p1  ORF type:complete len:202 (+),score=48.81 TRINITY_DN2296_c0_g1_i1:64-606(+)